jgi:AcrR family transcriptional regulator
MSRSTSRAPASRRRSTQAERSARTRSALLESAARGLSRYGYGNLVLEQVAREAGYTRGALYHQFKDKEDLALAVVEWADETWRREVGGPAERQPDPVAALIALARGHAVLCRRDVARVAMALRLEFSGQDHPVGRELERVSAALVKRCARLIDAGRKDGSIPAGPPARAVALALVGAIEGAVIALAGQAPHDELLAARAAAGVLGLDSPPARHRAARATDG